VYVSAEGLPTSGRTGHLAVETPRIRLKAAWRGHLHMVQTDDRHARQGTRDAKSRAHVYLYEAWEDRDRARVAARAWVTRNWA
jgi:hypothetical protein